MTKARHCGVRIQHLRISESIVLGLLVSLYGAACSSASSDPPSHRGISFAAVDRGRYLATATGCNDCHTPKVMTPSGPVLDSARLLSGHPAGVPIPAIPSGLLGPGRWGALTLADLTAWAGPWGVSFAANLTPDSTGMRDWTPEQFVQTMRTGKHFGVGRAILPPMPWPDIGTMTDEDLRALFAYLKSIKPVANRVPLPIPPGKATARR